MSVNKLLETVLKSYLCDSNKSLINDFSTHVFDGLFTDISTP